MTKGKEELEHEITNAKIKTQKLTHSRAFTISCAQAYMQVTNFTVVKRHKALLTHCRLSIMYDSNFTTVSTSTQMGVATLTLQTTFLIASLTPELGCKWCAIFMSNSATSVTGLL